MNKRFAIILPAYNEEENVGDVVRECISRWKDADVLVVNDGSADSTAAVARDAGATVLSMPCNQGVGPAVQAGLKWAQEHGFDLAVRMDSDGQHTPDQIENLFSKMEESGADLVTGSRFLKESKFSGSTGFRRFSNRVLAIFLSAVCRARVTDPTSGFWCVRGSLLRYFAHDYPCEYPEPEALALLRRQGYSLAEAPVRVLPRAHGKSHIRTAGAVYFALRVGLALLADRVRPVDRRFAKQG